MESLETKGDIKSAFELLGGERILKARIRNAMDAHDAITHGLDTKALFYMISSVSLLESHGALQKAIGVSLRTLQRHKASKNTRRLSIEQSSRTWRFAEIFSLAVRVMGSEEAAEAWLDKPAIGLSNRKPIDLLQTSAGAEAVEEYLTRIEYGVYA
ncbi:type II RES/Xre toxin-antitoxin system antitoxin [Oceanibaculum indicum]|uniref:Uncharacterized protein n=1 Tax=Oceanibaculum indicum P24 TaxID=1207063 RepID=K2JPP1_9PROT|nr:antitoxin Xre/MbcA/ParS toxin-binding domain-containing protein [Oceanibaculum indicum]EKE67180.1 hypothetical protein P24_18834 [Oceanibaculum indicum P24]